MKKGQIKSRIKFYSLGLLIYSLLLAMPLRANESAATYKIQELDFLTGCWQSSVSQKMVVKETFTSPRSKIMLGNSQTTMSGKTVLFEFFTIQETEDGIVFQPYPNGKQASEFKLTALSRTKAVFENKDNDFPKVITYERKSESQLTATISGDDPVNTQGFEMVSVSCNPA